VYTHDHTCISAKKNYANYVWNINILVWKNARYVYIVHVFKSYVYLNKQNMKNDKYMPAYVYIYILLIKC